MIKGDKTELGSGPLGAEFFNQIIGVGVYQMKPGKSNLKKTGDILA